MVFVGVDLVAPILKLIAIVLHSAVIEALPLSAVDQLHQFHFLLVAHDLLHHEQPGNAALFVVLGAVGNACVLSLPSYLDLEIPHYHEPSKILVLESMVKERPSTRQAGKATGVNCRCLSILKAKEAVTMPGNSGYWALETLRFS